jgi:hypothetical protein
MTKLSHSAPAHTVNDRMVLRAVGLLLVPHVRGLSVDPARGLVVDVDGYTLSDLASAGAALLALARLEIGAGDPYFRRLVDVGAFVRRLAEAVDVDPVTAQRSTLAATARSPAFA